MHTTDLWLALVVLLCAALVLARRRRRTSSEKRAAVPVAPVESAADSPSLTDAAPGCATPLDEDIDSRFFRLALQLDVIPVLDRDGRQMLSAIGESLADAVLHRQYFPRRPLLVPQLLRAVNDDANAPRALAAIVLQDPVLAGDVLTVANSCYYRVDSRPVETMDRAVLLLGTDGLKSVLATCLLRPVILAGQAAGDRYSSMLWERALQTATAASAYATQSGACDRYSAHLIGLLSALGPLMLFRCARDFGQRYRAGMHSSSALIFHLLRRSGQAATERIAESWELPDAFRQAMAEQSRSVPASPLGRALRFGERVATCAMLHHAARIDFAVAQAVVEREGLRESEFIAMWHALHRPAVLQPAGFTTAPPAAQ